MSTASPKPPESVRLSIPRGARRVLSSLTAAIALAAPCAAQPLTEENRPRPGSGAPEEVAPAPATEEALAGFQERPIREVKITGLSTTDPALVTNQVRSRTGQPLNADTVRADVQRLNRLGRFKSIDAKITPYDDGSILLEFVFVETPIIQDVQAVGNRQLTDADLASVIGLLKETPVDEFQLGAARSQIEKLYRDKGYFQATVTVDREELEKNGIVLFRINEGERVRVTEVRFEGSGSFADRQLRTAIKTTEAGIFETGPVDPEQLDRDVAALISFYRDRGYLDVRADRRITFSPNGREAIVAFLIEEGPVYTLRGVRSELVDRAGRSESKEPGVFTTEQIAGLLHIKTGDVYSVDRVRKSMDAIRNAYLKLGYVDARVSQAELRNPDKPEVELLLSIREGQRFKTGLITVKGNELTRTNVVLRQLDDLKPDRPLDASQVRRGERLINRNELKIEETRLFEPGATKITIQPPDPANPEHRDVLVEVKETNTGSIGFGAGVSSDGGVIGQISLSQRNFDVMDWPDSFGEMFSGRAFRGAGQIFNITVAPGTEIQTYSIALQDPGLFDTDYTGSVQAFYRTREYDAYDENRYGARWALGRRFGERWLGALNFRAENVDIRDIDDDAPVDLFEVEGQSVVTGIGASLTRNTTDSRFRPTRGARMLLEAEQVGAMGGDYTFTRLGISHVVFLPVYEDFLGYKTVLSMKVEANYIPQGSDEAPIFERLYLGGSSFRGFEFRTVSPKGIRNDTMTLGDDPVGGSWLFFAGLEITQPLYKDVVSLVGFLDTGTVTDEIGFSDYRVSVGVGLRLYVEQLSPVPLAFDLGFPILKEDGDEERLFSFSLDLPF